ncbi:MAG: hypothetical protein F6K03_17465, partial [Kamptonema sp. SIO4C4]|nr:hypothetical protein [Kamptonema sp. SIO4C4]
MLFHHENSFETSSQQQVASRPESNPLMVKSLKQELKQARYELARERQKRQQFELQYNNLFNYSVVGCFKINKEGQYL